MAFIEGYVFSHQAGVRGLYRGVRVLTSGVHGLYRGNVFSHQAGVRGLYRGVRVLTSGRGAWPL